MKATYLTHMGTDMDVASAARVSFKKEASHFTTAENHKLIAYLGKHKHLSPFGHNFLRLHIKAPIFVRSQLVKHEYLRMNEVSRRYVDDPPELYFPLELREKAKDKKQGSGDAHSNSDGWLIVAEDYLGEVVRIYDEMIKDEVCPEQARMVLPQNMYTEWWWSGSMDAFANMCNLRCKPDTQLETQQIAYQIDDICKKLWPHSWKALRDA